MSSTNVRRPELDVFRGFAIFGIFFVNITIMHSVMLFQDGYLAQFTDPLSEFAKRTLQLFFYNKFFPIFSFLFGLGLSMQMRAKMNKSQPYVAFFVRRMLLLFIVGMIHVGFLWSGDVLHLYAILGILCIVVIQLPIKWLLVASILLLTFPFYDNMLIAFSGLFDGGPEHAMVKLGSEGVADIVKQGTLVDIIQLHVTDYVASLPMVLFYLAPMALSMFLLGICVGKSHDAFGSEQWVISFKRVALWVFIATTVYRITFLWVLPEFPIYRNEILRPLWFKLMFLSDIAFGLWYLWLMAWLWHFTRVKRLLVMFEAVGRMALTNYLLQSMIGLVLFTSVGFSLYESLSPITCLVIAFASFILQSIFSRLWLSHFQYGPFEWLWRCGSYMRWYPLKRH